MSQGSLVPNAQCNPNLTMRLVLLHIERRLGRLGSREFLLLGQVDVMKNAP